VVPEAGRETRHNLGAIHASRDPAVRLLSVHAAVPVLERCYVPSRGGVVMWSLLDPRLWLAALVLVGAASGVSYLKGRSDGKTICEAKHAQAVTAANVEARKIESRRQAMVDEGARTRAAAETRLRSDLASARSLRDGLLDVLNATQRYAEESHAAATRATAALDSVFRDCTRAYLDMAEAAQRHADDAVMLRDGWPR
jgi:hypothetical protein